MIDIHTHFLPGIDDGAKSGEMSLDMLCSAAEQGVTLCVATPHCVVHGNDDVEVFADVVSDAGIQIAEAAQDIGNAVLLLHVQITVDAGFA